MEQAKLQWAERGRGAGKRDIVFFRVPNSLEGCDGWDGGGAYYFDHGGPTSGLKGSILFLGDE
jgi:hypothetical protein